MNAKAIFMRVCLRFIFIFYGWLVGCLVGWLVDNEQTKIKITLTNNDYENVHRWRLGCVPDRRKKNSTE